MNSNPPLRFDELSPDRPRDSVNARSRTRRVLALAGATLVVMALCGSTASAQPRVDAVWSSSTGSGQAGQHQIEAAIGDQLTLLLRISPDFRGISSFGVSLEFDSGLELIAEPVELLPAEFEMHITTGVLGTSPSDAGQIGTVTTVEAVHFAAGPATGTLDVAELRFRVSGAVDPSSGAGVRVGVFNNRVDDLYDNNGRRLSSATLFNGASVRLPNLPEQVPFASMPMWWVLAAMLLLLGRAVNRSRVYIPTKKGSRQCVD